MEGKGLCTLDGKGGSTVLLMEKVLHGEPSKHEFCGNSLLWHHQFGQEAFVPSQLMGDTLYSAIAGACFACSFPCCPNARC